LCRWDGNLDGVDLCLGSSLPSPDLYNEKTMILQRAYKKAEEAHLKRVKRVFNDAAKKARKWRMDGKLEPAQVYETGYSKRLLKRF
jgi:hypothetical protein